MEEGVRVRNFEPGTFTTFGPPTQFGCIGTGAEYVTRAINRNNKLGHNLPVRTLVDMLFTASHFADAASESIAVDDLLAVAMLTKDRTYLLGDGKLTVEYAPAPIRKNWPSVAGHWNEFQATIKAYTNESFEAQRLFSKIYEGELTTADTKQLDKLNAGVVSQRKRLAEQINSFQQDYDNFLKVDVELPIPNGDPI